MGHAPGVGSARGSTGGTSGTGVVTGAVQDLIVLAVTWRTLKG